MFYNFFILLFILLIPQFSFSQTQDSTRIEVENIDSLRAGLKSMLQMLKNGEKERAIVWFKKNYHNLHLYNLLSDSMLTALYSENQSKLNPPNDGATSIVSDSVRINKKLHAFIKKELTSIATELGESPDVVLPLSFIKDVEKYVAMFSEDPGYKNFFQQALNRSRKYIPLFKDIFSEKGFPKELLYFVIIESGFDANAISKAGAAGMFQFMPATARQYGLRIDDVFDERFSAYKSAKAAANYLKDLYLELGDINLALTSYNSGSGKTRAALKELPTLKERGFWAIREKSKKLAKETREYVPQIFAAIVLAKEGNPEKFQFNEPGFPADSSYAVFFLPDKINIEHLCSALNISGEIFFKLNPDINDKRITTPENISDYPLFVPKEAEAKCRDFLIGKFGNKNFDGSDINPKKVSIKKPKKKSKAKKRKKKPGFDLQYVREKNIINEGEEFYYVVKRANTLHLVARIFEVSEKDLMRWNNLKYKSLRKDKILKIKASKPIIKYLYEIPKKISYRMLAQQFEANANVLKKTNNFKGEFLKKGEQIIVFILK